MNALPAYGLLMIGGIVVSATIWQRIARSRSIPSVVFIGGLVGAVLGAKVAYLFAEMPFIWHQPNFWQNLLIGRTVLGGLLGGYAGVEWGKAQMRYTPPTGDLFALAVPLGLAIGRIGCYLQGCCLGRVCSPAWYAITDPNGHPRFPASLMEAAFNLLFLAVAVPMYRRGIARGQLFHIYLIAYGLFRFGHEFLRDTPKIICPFSPYHLLALAVVALGARRYAQRATGTVSVCPNQ